MQSSRQSDYQIATEHSMVCWREFSLQDMPITANTARSIGLGEETLKPRPAMTYGITRVRLAVC